MNDIPRGTSYAKIMNSLLAPSHQEDASAPDKVHPHVLCSLVMTDSTLDDELSVANIKFSDTPKWLQDLNQDPYGFPKYTRFGTLWRGVDRQATDEQGQTEFIRAVIRSNGGLGLYYAEMLAEFEDTDVNAQDYRGRSALHWACAESLPDMVKLCLSVPACDTGLRDKDNGCTAFDIALQIGNDLVPNMFYTSMLQLEETHPQAALLRILTITADPANAKDRAIFPGEAIFDPIEARNGPLVAALIARGIDLTVRNNDGDTALHVAVKSGSVEIARTILQHGADMNVKDGSGLTALYLAEEIENDEMVALLNRMALEVNKVEVSAVEIQVPIAPEVTKDGGAEQWPLAMEAEAELSSSIPGTVAMPVPTMEVDQLAEKKNFIRVLLGNMESTDHDGQTALHRAVLQRDLKTVQLLLEVGINREAVDNSTCTPLHLAVKQGSIEIVKLLLARRAKIDARTINQDTALHLAVQRGETEITKLLLARGAYIHAINDEGCTALHQVAKQGATDAVTTLLANGARIEAITAKGYTALHLAAEAAATKVVKVLIAGGAQIETATIKGYTALHLATMAGASETVRVLLASGAQVEAIGMDRFTALHLAANARSSFPSGYLMIVKELLGSGAQLEAVTTKGHTALHLAAQAGSTAILQALLNSGANIEAITALRYTALHMATRRGAKEIVEALVARGASLEATTVQETTALHVAVLGGWPDIVKSLLAGGAQPEAMTSQGYTALHLVAQTESARVTMVIIETLLASGAQIDALSSSGYTALHLAAQNGYAVTVKGLLVNGARIETRSPTGTALQIATLHQHTRVIETLRANGAHRKAGRLGHAMRDRLGRKDSRNSQDNSSQR